MARNLKLTIEYDGTDFAGWQTQPNERTVQGEIEKVLTTILGKKIELVGSGRTDSGVHAFGQIANFKVGGEIDPAKLLHSLNSMLPNDVVIRELSEVPEDFHARYSAISRIYSYRIHLGRSALNHRHVWELPYDLGLEELKWCAEVIRGEHDFTSFCVAKSQKDDCSCEVLVADWKKVGRELLFHIEADRFLHTMVRSLVGTMVEVGRGFLPKEQFREILELEDRTKAGPTAPAKGLCLVAVRY
ncbi:MAG: tRNA pseudouridine(38-40) synthase TruA [Candidatus Zixiibacteriota bacterium]